MTEDDTFRILKKIPFTEMLQILKDMGFVFMDEKHMSPVLDQYGWTFDEFLKEKKEYVRKY